MASLSSSSSASRREAVLWKQLYGTNEIQRQSAKTVCYHVQYISGYLAEHLRTIQFFFQYQCLLRFKYWCRCTAAITAASLQPLLEQLKSTFPFIYSNWFYLLETKKYPNIVMKYWNIAWPYFNEPGNIFSSYDYQDLLFHLKPSVFLLTRSVKTFYCHLYSRWHVCWEVDMWTGVGGNRSGVTYSFLFLFYCLLQHVDLSWQQVEGGGNRQLQGDRQGFLICDNKRWNH